MGSLTHDELRRYSRHLILPQFGREGQEKLKHARVLVIGSGGLGSPVLLYLAAAGVGTIGIVDFDVVDESNLQRQVLFTVDDIGQPKVDVARRRLNALNPHVHVQAHPVRLTSANAMDVLSGYDIIADGTDNFPTRYLTNDACVFLKKPLVYASIYQFEGQVSVFNGLDESGRRGPNYRDLFPIPPPPNAVPSCAEGGVLGVLPGIIGSMQANEVLKLASGIGTPLIGRLLIFDALRFETRILRFTSDPENPLSGDPPRQTTLIDYEEFCGFGGQQAVRQMTAVELKQLIDSGQPFQLIDVREPAERELVHIGGELIPLATIEVQANRIARDRPVIIYCKTGARSAHAARLLHGKDKFTNLYNLSGGILAYLDAFMPDAPRY